MSGFPSYYETVRMAHAVLGCLTFVVILPLGGILVKAGNFKGLVWAHAAVQLLGYAFICFVFGSGLWSCYLYGDFYVDPHIEIGMILFSLATFQPFIGTIHHLKFKRYNRRTLASVVHVLLGRTMILLGIVNGGLGLFVANNAKPMQLKAYGIVGGIMYFVYLFTISFLEARNAKEQKWMEETQGSLAKKEMGIEAKKLGVYEDKDSQ